MLLHTEEHAEMEREGQWSILTLVLIQCASRDQTLRK